jgi:hypothetical protein
MAGTRCRSIASSASVPSAPMSRSIHTPMAKCTRRTPLVIRPGHCCPLLKSATGVTASTARSRLRNACNAQSRLSAAPCSSAPGPLPRHATEGVKASTGWEVMAACRRALDWRLYCLSFSAWYAEGGWVWCRYPSGPVHAECHPGSECATRVVTLPAGLQSGRCAAFQAKNAPMCIQCGKPILAGSMYSLPRGKMHAACKP